MGPALQPYIFVGQGPRALPVRWGGRPRGSPLRTSIGKRCVGADAYIGPVAPIFKPCVGAGDREGRPYAKIYIGSSHTKVSLDSRGKK